MRNKILPLFIYRVLQIASTGAYAQGGALLLNGSVDGNFTSGTADVWDVTTTSDGLLRLTFSTVSPADLYVSLYDNDGTTLIAGPLESYNNSTVTLYADGLAAGTYHVKITPYSTATYGLYKLADSFFISPLANDTEPNGTIAAALVLPQNGSKTGHLGHYYNAVRDTTDWYKVTTSVDGLLRVSLSTERTAAASNNFLDVNVTLYDSNGITQLGSAEIFNGNNPATGNITADGLAPGTYYIKVQSYATTEFADYTISDSLFLPPVATDAEPNGTLATASVFALNSSAVGHTGYYYNNQRDTADWYTITATAAGPLHVYLSSYRGNIYSNNTLDMILTFYGSDGTTQLGSKEVFNSNGPAEDSLTFVTLAAGTYFIKVTNYATTEFGDYTLSNSVAGGILPVTFINFSGRLADNKALLNWSTATEINNKGFEVEKSTDGQLFTGMGFISGTGNSSVVNTYHYTDNKVVSGSNYYRIRQINLDGNFIYSPIIRLDFSKFEWTVFGNPVTSNTRIELQLDRKAKVAIQVLATDGKLIETIDKGTISKGTYSIPLPLLNVPSGIYMVSLLIDHQQYSKTIIK